MIDKKIITNNVVVLNNMRDVLIEDCLKIALRSQNTLYALSSIY